MTTKDDCIQKYTELKSINGTIPKKKEFLEFTGIHEGKLTALFGRNAYSKLQLACGDKPNKLPFKRTPRETIMRQYGDLALELGELPNSSDWIERDLRPSIVGLSKKPHFIKWSDFPRQFGDWAKADRISGYETVLAIIAETFTKPNGRLEEKDRVFDRLIDHIRLWSPARRRNSEEAYKIELRSHLKSLGYEVNEEFGQSNCDLLINMTYVIEAKKDPKLGDYDRLFGQLARHLQHQRRVVALIFDAPGEDNFSNFSALVDSYLNKDKKTVEIVKK